jgi:hypothetical protein
MASISEALTELGITEWVLRGEPTTEAEFNSRCSAKSPEQTLTVQQSKAATKLTGVCGWATVNAKLTELNAAEPLKLLRAERDRLIAATDWWASSDLTMSAERTAYRQALRDITDSYTSLDDVVWPTKPE